MLRKLRYNLPMRVENQTPKLKRESPRQVADFLVLALVATIVTIASGLEMIENGVTAEHRHNHYLPHACWMVGTFCVLRLHQRIATGRWTEAGPSRVWEAEEPWVSTILWGMLIYYVSIIPIMALFKIEGNLLTGNPPLRDLWSHLLLFLAFSSLMGVPVKLIRQYKTRYEARKAIGQTQRRLNPDHHS